MKVLVACLVLAAVATAQQQDAQQGLREFLQHLMNLEQRHQRVAQQDGEDVIVSNVGVPLIEIPDEGVYEVYQDPSDLGYYRDPQQENYIGYKSDKYESAGKLSYHAPELYRPKRQAPASASNPTSSDGNPNRLTTFINSLGSLSTNLRRQTTQAIRNTLRNPPRLFPGTQPQTNSNPLAAAVAAHNEAQKPTSLNDVYGASLGARANRNRRSVGQSYAAVIDLDDVRSAVERSQAVPQVREY